jgi:hypothetical protein
MVEVERCLYKDILRRFIAIALLAIFGLPFATSLLALTPRSEANLPACCRRNGKHHCMMAMQETQTSGDQVRLSAPPEKCPYVPGRVLQGSQQVVFDTSSQRAFGGLVGHSAVFAQMESMWRISRDRSKQKRGPPSPFFPPVL